MCHARVCSGDEPVWCCNRRDAANSRCTVPDQSLQAQRIKYTHPPRSAITPSAKLRGNAMASRSPFPQADAGFPSESTLEFCLQRCENIMRRFPNGRPPFTCSNLLCRPLQRSCTVPLNRIAAALSRELRDLRQLFPSLAVRAECMRIPVAAAPSGARPRRARSLPHRPGR